MGATIERIEDVTEHENADNLELVRVGGYTSIVKKGIFCQGDPCVYVEEGSIVPDEILRRVGLLGCLAGSAKNRVKALKLRGVVSQGLVLTIQEALDLSHESPAYYFETGTDVSELMGVTKYIPEAPKQLAGNVCANPFEHRLYPKYDIKNIKKFNRVLIEGEWVTYTEKIHGTFACYIFVPQPDGTILEFVSSKGLAGRDVGLKIDDPANANNLYVRVLRKYRATMSRVAEIRGKPVYFMGEIFGKGMQDLDYGAVVGDDDTVGFRLFDIHFGFVDDIDGYFLDEEWFNALCSFMELPRVPALYGGPHSQKLLDHYTNGMETVSGKALHLREGVVVKPLIERTHGKNKSRVILKSVSQAYLLRKKRKGVELTEYN